MFRRLSGFIASHYDGRWQVQRTLKRKPTRANAFYAWHSRFCADLVQLESISGIDRLGEVLKGLFGSRPATAAIDSLTERVSAARRAGNLRVAPGIGLSVGTIAASTPVRANTFYGSI